MSAQSLIEVEGTGSWSSTPSQARLSAEWSRTGTSISSQHVSSLARFLILLQESYPVALVVSVWRLSFSCDQVAKLGLGFQPLVRRQRSADYKLLNPC